MRFAADRPSAGPTEPAADEAAPAAPRRRSSSAAPATAPMYARFFGVRREPFSIAPDPRYLFMSERHREALAHLLYGVGGGGGFVLLTGEIGAGKTTVCRCFLEQIPKRCNVAYIFNPKLTVIELLRSVCDEFRIPRNAVPAGAATVKDYLDPLNEFLLATHAVGQNNVLIIDEAQNLSADVLEQLRLLTNLETAERKLLQIILIGQPELRTMLARPELEQLAQRVIARFHLEALSESETRQYIRHRLAVAGRTSALPFDRPALQRIHKLSRGVPRRINLLCDRALLGAYGTGKASVDLAIVDKAAAEVFQTTAAAAPQRLTPRMASLAWGAAGGIAVLAVGGLALWSSGMLRQTQAPVAAAASAPAVSGARGAAASAASAVAGAASAPSGSATAASAAPPASGVAGALANAPRSEREALRALAPAWKLTPGDGDPCQQAQQLQVHCLRMNGSLAQLRQFDRPAVLALRDDADKPVYAVLTGLTPQGAVLRIDGSSRTLPLAALASHWRGDFTTFWRVPPGYQGRPVDATSGQAADWLAAQLAAIDAGPAASAAGAKPASSPPTESALRNSIAAFQLAQGLRPDGIAGPTTFMQLNRAVGIDEPRLQAER